VESNDPNRPQARAPVVGRSAVELTASLTRIDFGTVGVGESTTRTIRIGNRSNSPLVLSDVTVTDEAVGDDPFEARVGFTLLNPGEFGSVEIGFGPATAGEVHGMLILSFGVGGPTTVALSLSGSARAAP